LRWLKTVHYRSHFKKKRIFTKKGGDIPEKHPLPSRAALSVISFFLHQLIVQFTCMA
jgi:hypothetical protein